MKIDIRDPSQIMSHILLHDMEIATAVSETSDWKDNKTITAEVTFNGIIVPTAVAESTFKELYAQIERQLAEKYADIEQQIQQRVEQLMKTEAAPILEKMYELQNALEDAGSIIKPYWRK